MKKILLTIIFTSIVFFANIATAEKVELSASAYDMINVLREAGLTDEDIMQACSERKSITASCPPTERLPEGYSVMETEDGCKFIWPDGRATATVSKGGKVTLKTWIEEMKTIDSKSVRNSAVIYLAIPKDAHRALYGPLVGVDGSFRFGDVTGLYLLAAALKVKDEKLALRIYEKLTEGFGSDDAMLEAGLNAIAWKFLRDGIEAYQKKNDDKALELLSKMDRFRKYAKPRSYLEACVKEADAVTNAINSRRAEVKAPMPDPDDQAASIKYWISRIKEINGRQMGQPGFPSVFFLIPGEEDMKRDPEFWQKEIKRMKDTEGIEPPFASHELRRIGIAALPALFEAFPDRTLTRTVGYWRDFNPTRYIVTAGGAAREIFTVICYDYGLMPPDFMKERIDLSVEENFKKAGGEFDEWYKKIPKDIKRLTKEERQKFIEEKVYKGTGKGFVDTPSRFQR